MSKLDLRTAGHGDCMIYSWGDPVKRILVDGGPWHFADDLRDLLMSLPEEERVFELLVITHVDDDHIGGWVDLLEKYDPVPGLRFKDIWFNGWLQLGGQRVPVNPLAEHFGPAQAERISKILFDRGFPWNEAFQRGPVCTTVHDPYPVRHIDQDVSLQVLGPTVGKMEIMRNEWEDVVKEVWQPPEPDTEDDGPGVPGAESYGAPPPLETWDDVLDLAATSTGRDTEPANGSSITLLLRHGDVRILLGGDGHAAELIEAIRDLSPEGPLRLDAFKVPHHGSKNNVSRDLVRAVVCPTWLISTNGAMSFKHPDAEAIARIVGHSRHQPATVVFNAASKQTKPWRDDVLPKMPGRFELVFPEPGAKGVVVGFGEA